jgi:hypothetical protein
MSGRGGRRRAADSDSDSDESLSFQAQYELQWELIRAAEIGDVAEMRAVIARGAEADWEDEEHGYETLGPAICSNRPAAVKFLLNRYHLSPDRSSMYGDLNYHPLDVAVKSGADRSLRVLLDAGSDVCATDYEGKLALELTVEQRAGVTEAARSIVEQLAAVPYDAAGRAAPSLSTRYVRAVIRTTYPDAPFAAYGGGGDLRGYSFRKVTPEARFHAEVKVRWGAVGVDVPGLFFSGAGEMAWRRRRVVVIATGLGEK